MAVFLWHVLWTYGTLGRKTEEGFSIFKEAELGINPEAGGMSRSRPYLNAGLRGI